MAPDERRQQASQEGKEVKKEEKVPFYKKQSTLLYSALFLVFGYLSSSVNGDENIVTTLLFVASMLIGGLSLFKVGLQNLIHFDFDMKTLMTVAVIGGAIIGEWAEVSLVVILFAISEALERFSMDKARQSIRSLMDIAPKEALVRRNGQEIMIDPLVQTLLDVYARQTGLEPSEQVIGGGTYGRLMKRGVAYGAMFPNSIDTMHQANEFMAVDDLMNAMAIYAEAIYELVK